MKPTIAPRNADSRYIRASHDDAINEIARRLRAAYVSYHAGYAGVDILLKRTPERVSSEWWLDLAEFVFRHGQSMERRISVKQVWSSREQALVDRAAELLTNIKELGRVTMATELGREMIIEAVSEWLKDVEGK